MSVLPLMPKATAVWLIDHTTLAFEQIAHFCGAHPLEVQGIADGEVALGIIGQDPVHKGLLTWDEIHRCEKDPSLRLHMTPFAESFIVGNQKKKARYTPVARRQDKPDAIAWLIKHHPALSDAQICKLIGTTKTTTLSIREKSHWNSQHIRPRDPVLLGLCSQTELDTAVAKLPQSKA